MFQPGVPFGSPTFGPALSGLPNLTATGTDQSSAYLISAADSVFTNVPPGTGCRLQVPNNQPYTIYNQSVNTLLIYPAFGDCIAPFAKNEPAYLSPNSSFTFSSFSSALTPQPRTWYVTGGSSSFDINSLEAGLTPVGADTVPTYQPASPDPKMRKVSWAEVFANVSYPMTMTFVGTYTSTQNNFALQVLLNGLSPTAEFAYTHPGSKATQVIVGGVAVPADSQVEEADAAYFYATTLTSTTGAVGLVGCARTLTDGAFAFGGNFIANDSGFNANCCGLEIDVGCTNASSGGFGLSFIGNFPAGTPFTSVGIAINTANNPFGLGMWIPDGGAVGAYSGRLPGYLGKQQQPDDFFECT